MRCNREAPARHAVAGIPSGVARDAAARSSARIDAMIIDPWLVCYHPSVRQQTQPLRIQTVPLDRVA